MPIPEPAHLVDLVIACPRPDCGSIDTKWRYYNNIRKAGHSQPCYFCNACNTQFTYGGTFREITKPEKLAARKAALARAKEAADQQAAALARAKAVAEQAALDAAALEVAKRVARKAKRAAKAAKAAKRAAKAAKKEEKAAKRAAKRTASELVCMGAEDPLDGSKRDTVRHPASPDASSEGEMMTSSELLPGNQQCEFLSQVDAVHVMEHVDDMFDEALILTSSESESLAGGAAEVDAALSLSEMSRVDGAGLDSGKFSLLDGLWGEHGGEIESGLAWLPDSCGGGSAEVDTRLAWSKDCGGGGLVDSGLEGSEVQWVASAGLETDSDLVDFMLTQHDDIDSGLEWMSDSCVDGSAPGDSGLGGFEMWIDSESAESEADLESADLVITRFEMDGLTLSPQFVMSSPITMFWISWKCSSGARL